jgi:hypothetical protein
MKPFLFLVAILVLSGCSFTPPIKSVHDVPLPPDLTSLQDYDSANSTSYETLAKQFLLSTIYLWNIPEGSTSAEFFVLPHSASHRVAQEDFYKTELAKGGWQQDDAEFLGIIDRWHYQSRRGKQTFVTTYLSLPGSKAYDDLVVRLLYPVYK